MDGQFKVLKTPRFPYSNYIVDMNSKIKSSGRSEFTFVPATPGSKEVPLTLVFRLIFIDIG